MSSLRVKHSLSVWVNLNSRKCSTHVFDMYLKLIGLFALVVPNVIGAPWKLEAKTDYSFSQIDTDDDKKIPFSIEEAVLGKFTVVEYKWNWINDSHFELYGFMNKTEVGSMSVKDGRYTTILDPSVLAKYNSSTFKFSPDRKLVLIKYDQSKLYRLSETARYAVYSVEKKTYYDVAKKARLEEAEWGPKNNSLVYIKDNNIYLVTNMNKKEETLKITTNRISGRLFDGKGDWVYEEQFLSSGNDFWISPNGNQLVYLSLDESNVTNASFPTYGEPRALADQYVNIVNIRYPKSGSKIPDYGLWHVTLNPLSKPKLLTKNEVGKEKFSNLKWINDDTVLYLQTNRVQNVSQTYTQSVTNPKEKKLLFEHKNPVGWANLRLPWVSKDGQRIVRIEGRPSGKLGNFNHLVLYNMKNSTSYPIAGGAPIDILDIIHWDEKKHFVYYSAALSNSTTETHVYKVSEDKNSKPICLTCDIPNIDHRCKSATALFSPNADNVLVLCNGPEIQMVLICTNNPFHNTVLLDYNPELRRELKIHRQFPEVKDLTVDIGGSFKADVRLFLPPNMDKSGKTKYPLLIYVYGGPASKNINDVFKFDWSLYMTTNQSVIYGLIDGRNTLRKGENMLFAGYRALGTFEMEDQINVTKYLQKTFPFVDSKRTGIWGWSYGGYATTKILEMDTSNVFKCGIAVAPVADWLYYNYVYTERYMGLPKDNPKGYEKSSVLNDVENLRNKQYLLIHGNADDNVHYQHAMMIAKTLERNNIPFESMSYPDEDHTLRGVKPHLYNTMDRFWKRCFNLKQ